MKFGKYRMDYESIMIDALAMELHRMFTSVYSQKRLKGLGCSEALLSSDAH